MEQISRSSAIRARQAGPAMMKINALSALASAESDVLRYALGFPNAASAAPDGTKDSLADPCVAVSSAEGTA